MFTDEGVHKENSPSYHFGMVASLKRSIDVLSELFPSHGLDLGRFNELVEKGSSFSKALIKPDGTIPLVGDSVYRVFGEQSLDLESGNFNYLDSGYFIHRDVAKKTYFLFKNGYLSDYHRHDDDLSFVFSFLGEDVVVDGGMYKHDRRDKIRNWLRSFNAHSLPFPYGAKRANRDIVAHKYSNAFLECGYVFCLEGTSNMFSLPVSRKIMMLSEGHLVFEDKCDNCQISSRFVVDGKLQVSGDGKEFLVKGTNIRCRFTADNTQKAYVLRSDKHKIYRSRFYGKLEPVSQIVFLSQGRKLSTTMKCQKI